MTCAVIYVQYWLRSLIENMLGLLSFIHSDCVRHICGEVFHEAGWYAMYAFDDVGRASRSWG